MNFRTLRSTLNSRSLILIISIIILGLVLRIVNWETSTSIRFEYDLKQAWNWGNMANVYGLVNVYDIIIIKNPDGNYKLDYVPLRLSVAWAWNKINQFRYSKRSTWKPAFTFNLPLLFFNWITEILSCIAIYLLVRDLSPKKSYKAGTISIACIAAMIFYLNPALIVSSFGRPSTDTWLLAPILWSIWCAYSGRWWAAGLILSIGAMLKGQVFIATPILIACAMSRGQIKSLLRFISGMLCGIAMIGLPWILTSWNPDAIERQYNPQIISWLFVFMIFIRCIYWFKHQSPSIGLCYFFITLTTAFISISVILLSSNLWISLAHLSLLAILISCIYLLSPKEALVAAISLVAINILITDYYFENNYDWLRIGIGYGASKFSNALAIEHPYNLGAILQNTLHWRSATPVIGNTVTAWGLLFTITFILLVITIFSTALLFQRRHVFFLSAFCLTWLIWFSFAPQIHERYLMFGAVLGCLTLAHHRGLFYVSVVFSLVSWLMTTRVMLKFGDSQGYLYGFGKTIENFANTIYPWFGIIIIIAVIYWMFVVLRELKFELPSISHNKVIQN